MNNQLQRRGPDDSGTFWHQSQNYQVGLGHRRLSILDLSVNGRQPQTFKHLTITFNGEIYNFKEIRQQLTSSYQFATECDTEVLLKAIYHFGLEPALAKFNGMFAMAIYDSQNHKLHLVRDRCGVKPLYWYQQHQVFLFGSELKALLQHPEFAQKICPRAQQSYFSYGFICEPYSIYQNCYKLNSGNYLTLDLLTQAISKHNYWHIADCYRAPKLNITESEAITEAEKLLVNACKYRTIADVPVGVFLSGGYDSSTITALLRRNQKVKTFTIGFDVNGFDEAKYASTISSHLGTEHYEYYCKASEALSLIDKIPEIWDEPFGDSSAIPTLLVSKMARRQVKVALSADGGDELLGGYQKYQRILKLQQLTNVFKFLPALMRLLSPLYINNISAGNIFYTKLFTTLCSNDIAKKLKAICQVFHDKKLMKLLQAELLDLDIAYDNVEKVFGDLEQLLAIDAQTFMRDDVLTKVDRATMYFGLEGREPLLDYKFIEFVTRLPANLKIKGNKTKYLLRKINEKYLPKKMMERPKVGFENPLGYLGKGNTTTIFC